MPEHRQSANEASYQTYAANTLKPTEITCAPNCWNESSPGSICYVKRCEWQKYNHKWQKALFENLTRLGKFVFDRQTACGRKFFTWTRLVGTGALPIHTKGNFSRGWLSRRRVIQVEAEFDASSFHGVQTNKQFQQHLSDLEWEIYFESRNILQHRSNGTRR